MKKLPLQFGFVGVILLTLSACGGGSSSTDSNAPKIIDNTGWGASRPSAAQKTSDSWLSSFQNAPIVPVNSTINDALSACPDAGYCILEIDKLALSETVNVTRSNTKFLGKKNNKITYSINPDTSGIFFNLSDNVKNIVFENLNLDGESTNYAEKSIHGFLIDGQNIENVALLKNHIHHLFSDDDAHGIAVYGTGNTEDSAVENIIIEANKLHDLRTGSSESIAINGNVKRWKIANNTVSHINNIAIDAIGGEGTSPVQKVNGRILPGRLDAARYGVIEGNSVSDLSTETNPAYGNEHSWAGGIYVDGAHHVYIANNTVTRSEWAYDIGAENCIESSFIFMQKNTAKQSYYGDLYLGGYRKGGYKEDKKIKCDPNLTTDDIEGHGYVQNITVKDNQFISVSTRLSRIQLENRVRKSIIIQAGVKAVNTDGKVSADENSIRITE